MVVCLRERHSFRRPSSDCSHFRVPTREGGMSPAEFWCYLPASLSCIAGGNFPSSFLGFNVIGDLSCEEHPLLKCRIKSLSKWYVVSLHCRMLRELLLHRRADAHVASKVGDTLSKLFCMFQPSCFLALQ